MQGGKALRYGKAWINSCAKRGTVNILRREIRYDQLRSADSQSKGWADRLLVVDDERGNLRSK